VWCGRVLVPFRQQRMVGVVVKLHDRAPNYAPHKASPQGLKSVRENWVVSPGLRVFGPPNPALKRGAKLVRPCGTRKLFPPMPPRDAKSRSHAHTKAPLSAAGDGTAKAVPFHNHNRAEAVPSAQPPYGLHRG